MKLPSLNTDRQQFMSFSADEQGAEINITNYPTRLRELESALQGQLSAANAQIQNVDAELARLQPQRGAVSPAQQLQAELLRINRRSLEAAASNSRALSESVRYLQRTAAILSPNDRPPTEAETDPTLNLLRTAFARDDDAHLVERMRAMAQGGLTFARDNPHQVLSEQDMATVTEMTERMLAAADSVDPDSISSLKDFVRNMEAMVSTASIGNLLSAPVQAAWRSYVVPHQGPSTPERLESMSALLPEALRDVAAGFGAHGYVDTANSVRDIGSFTQEHLQDILAQISNVEEEFITERPQPAQLSSEPYEYDELPTATSLRLLRIHSVQDGIVYCSLDVADLTCLSQRSFTALSYVWGDHRPPSLRTFTVRELGKSFQFFATAACCL
ncbi:hypothetical protein H2203_002734 [Taxawa tesnikishii (nom. ined.)]|nr:hypothetical protein H2203_002734 [Dothideales sp. JES 119]